MLVLSRRVDEVLVFPSLDIRIKILRTVGNRVRLGIEAPSFIEVMRGECIGARDPQSPEESVWQHKMRNRWNAVKLALELYDRQMSRGNIDAANQTFLRLVSQLRQADLEQTAESVVTRPEPAVGSPKVLVVDDDANERQLLAGLLEMDGCLVETANDGMDAIEFLRRGAVPDVVLLDMQMPKLGGKETLAAIRDGWRKLLVFGVSGSTAADNDISVGGPRGIDEWFEKPLNPVQLVKCIHQRLKTASVSV